MESAEHIISDLIKQGMIVTNTASAEELITYKTNYSMLKRNKICFYNQVIENISLDETRQYEGIYFDDFSISSNINHLLTIFHLKLIHNFEHHLKVYMEELYQGMNFLEKNKVKDIFKNASVNKFIGSAKINGLFDSRQWANCKIPFRNCSEENWKKVVDEANNFSNPKWYYVLEDAFLSEISNLYIRCFAQAGETVLCCNKQHNGAYSLKGGNTFLNRMTYRRNDVSHQNLLFNYLKPSTQLCKSIKQFVDWVEPSKYDQIMKKTELYNLLTKNAYNFDFFYLIMTKDSLLSRHVSLNNRRKKFYEYTIDALKEIVERAGAYHYCDEWVVETICFYKKCIEIISRIEKNCKNS